MSQVWKYELKSGREVVHMPVGAKPLCVQVQKDVACLWAEVEPDKRNSARTFVMVGNGWEVPEGGVYIGTVQRSNFVWHYYEVPK